MFTLVTGGPGAGKTAYLVDLLMGIDPTRPIFNDGLEGLKLPGRVVHELDARNWPDVVPDGAIVVVDEAQRVWRPRGPSAAAPRHVTEMETHRHRGLDFFCTTQGPRLVDSNIRALVGRHVHIRDTGVLGRHMYEWPECNENMAWRACVNKRKYKLPRRAFGNYVSASLHTKPVRNIPRALMWGALVVLLALALAFLVYRIVTRGSPVPAPAVETKPAASGVVASASPGAAPGAAANGASRAIDDRVDWFPRVSSKPESAPAFDHLRIVTAMPRVVGCVEFKGKARCFTQQGTDAGLDDREARAWMERPVFNAYAVAEPVERPTPSAEPKNAPEGLAGPVLTVIDTPARAAPPVAKKQS